MFSITITVFKEIVILELESIMRLGSCLMSFFLIAQTLFVLLYVPSFSHKVYTCIDLTRLDSQLVLMVWHGLCLWSSSFPVSSMHVKDSYLTTWKLNVRRTKAAWQLWRSYIVEKMLFGEKKHSLCSNKNKYTDPLHFWDKWLVFRYKRRSFEFVYCSYKSMNNFKNGAALLFSISLHNLFLDNVWFCNTTPRCDKHFTNEHVLQKISSAKLYWLGLA